jgi:hypothetical protein
MVSGQSSGKRTAHGLHWVCLVGGAAQGCVGPGSCSQGAVGGTHSSLLLPAARRTAAWDTCVGGAVGWCGLGGDRLADVWEHLHGMVRHNQPYRMKQKVSLFILNIVKLAPC